MASGKPEVGSPKVIYGRGGAGNIASKDAQPPEPVTDKMTPTLKGNVYTTGRGGTGNMAKNDFGEEAREAQDVDVPPVTLAEGAQHTGRGGAANTYKPSDTEAKEAKLHNERVRKQSFDKHQAREGGVKSLMEKGKEVLRGG